MTTSKFKLNALDKFACLAADCPDSCCTYGWNITVDKQTLKKWETIEDTKFRNTIFEALFEEKIGGVTEKMISSKGRICGLRDNDGLCLIHDRLGENYLGNTCKTFPRQTKYFSNYLLNSAVMSCPEIVRLVLEESKVSEVFKLDGEFNYPEDPSINIDTFITTVLSKNNYSIAAKITTISRFLTNFSNLSEKGELTLAGFNALCRKLNKPLKNAESDVKSRRIKIENGVASLFWYVVYQIVTSSNPDLVDVRIKNHAISDILNKKSYSEESCSRLFKEITRIRNSSESEIRKIMAGIGERYLLVKFKSVGFPLSPPAENYIAAFLFGVIPYCFINLCLWIIFDVEKKLSVDDVVNVIYKTERIVQHSELIYKAIVKHKELLHIDEFEACFSDLL